MDTTRRRERTEIQAHVSFEAWLKSPLFLSYVRRFVLLWIAGKIANAATASLAGVPSFSFRPGTELVILVFELGALVAFIKRDNEDILLANLGLRLAVALAPLVLVHVVLSAALALFVR